MALKSYNPTSPGRRGLVLVDKSALWKGKPVKAPVSYTHLELEVRELLSSYDFPGDDIPIIKGSALAALEGRDDAIGKDSINALMAAVDSYIPQPPRPTDKPFLMPVEDVFSISGRGTVVTGRIAVSYTHLDVYKRQIANISPSRWTSTSPTRSSRAAPASSAA